MELFKKGPYFEFMKTDEIGFGIGFVVIPYRTEVQFAAQVLCWSVAIGIVF